MTESGSGALMLFSPPFLRLQNLYLTTSQVDNSPIAATMKGITLRQQRLKPQGLFCQFCEFSSTPAQRVPLSRQFATKTPTRRTTHISQLRSTQPWRASLASVQPTRRFASSTSNETPAQNPAARLQQIDRAAQQLRTADTTPSNELVIQLLQGCQTVAETLVQQEQDERKISPKSKDGNAVSSLLDLDEKTQTGTRKPTTRKRHPDAQLAESVSKLSNAIVKDEKVFISPEALAAYTKTHALLRKPEHFPEIFHLYANKPVPEANSHPIKYSTPNPKSINNAIPTDLANLALDIAIETKNLGLVVGVIDQTFCAPAFHRSKVFRKASFPILGLGCAPAACYGIASWLSTMQVAMDPAMAKGIMVSCIFTYVFGTSSLALLSILTHNDQMERVVWIPGVPLRQRWLREEERAALDRVAVAWGFKDISMRGEEEGEEWESLREFIGLRGMILDKTDLMPGMQ